MVDVHVDLALFSIFQIDIVRDLTLGDGLGVYQISMVFGIVKIHTAQQGAMLD